jgi:nuclear pore complex protein Nup93
MPPSSSSSHASSGLSSTEVMPIPNKTIIENKSAVYAAVVRDFNGARGRSLPFSVSFASFSIFNMSFDISGYKF